MRRVLSGVVAVALAVGTTPVRAEPALAKDAEVRKGIQAVEDGEYDAAILILDGAARRLAAKPNDPDLSQAYLHLGIAYVGKGAEAAAKAKFREALRQIRDLSLSADKYPPKVINVFEAARDEVSRDAPAAVPAPVAAAPTAAPAAPRASGGGGNGKLLLIGGAVAAAGVGAAVALGGGDGGEGPGGGGNGANGGLTTDTFPNEVVVFGGGREFPITVRGSGTLSATVRWNEDGVILGMYIVNLANAGTVLKDGDQTGVKEVKLSTPVTPGNYRISVTNSTGRGPQVTTTFNLSCTHP